jgi:hypothetical protein
VSASYGFRPVPKLPKSEYFCIALASMIATYTGEQSQHDLGGIAFGTDEDRAWLRGVIQAIKPGADDFGNDVQGDAQRLLDAIEKYGSLILTVER